MIDPMNLPNDEFSRVVEQYVKEYYEARLAVTLRIIEAHGMPFAAWISADEMIRSLAVHCKMSKDPSETATNSIAKFISVLERLVNGDAPTLPEPTHPMPGATQ